MSGSRLILQSLAGMTFLLLVMGLALFVPAGTFHYSLAWLYLVIFFGSVLWITIYLFLFDRHLLRSRLTAGPIGERSTTQKAIQSVAGLAFIGLFVVSAFDRRYHWSNVPLRLSYLCDLLCVLAFAFLFFVFRQNTFLSATIEVQEKQRVISTGIYGIVRHPMYSIVLKLMLFTPPALGSWWGLIPWMVLTGVIVFRAVDEERQLKLHLDGYDAYCRKVRYRLIPFVF